MGRAHRRAISLLLLAMFAWMGFSAHAFSAKWLSHDMDHERGAIVALADQGRDHQEPASEPLSDAEHILLHALGYLDPAPHSVSIGFGDRGAGKPGAERIVPASCGRLQKLQLQSAELLTKGVCARC